jgi:hypothetical protein
VSTKAAPGEPLDLPLPDYERIEQDVRAGILTLREIARQYRSPRDATRIMSHVAILKMSKLKGWDADLREKIAAKAEVKLQQAEAKKAAKDLRAMTSAEVIEANAERIAQVRSEHRGDIGRMRELARSLMAELIEQTDHLEDMQALREIIAAPGDKQMGKLAAIFDRVISTGDRIDSGVKLSMMFKNLIGIEREAYGLTADKDGSEGKDALSGMSAGDLRKVESVLSRILVEEA